MHNRVLPLPFLVFVYASLLLCMPPLFAQELYTVQEPSRDGIGKYYMGREISKVMGHLGAGWLERSGRENEERTDLLIENLGLRPTDHVADIGAGSGYFTFRMSPLVPEGKVFAIDISTQMLGIIRAKMEKKQATILIPF